MRQHVRELSDVIGRDSQRGGGLDQVVLLGLVKGVGLRVVRLRVFDGILDERKRRYAIRKEREMVGSTLISEIEVLQTQIVEGRKNRCHDGSHVIPTL